MNKKNGDVSRSNKKKHNKNRKNNKRQIINNDIIVDMQTLKELAVQWEIAESTLRLYRDELNELIPTQGTGRRRRYDERGADALRRIIAWKREGKTVGQIRNELTRENRPQAAARQRSVEIRLDEIAARLTAQQEETALLRVEVSALRADFARLLEAMRLDAVPTFEQSLEAERRV